MARGVRHENQTKTDAIALLIRGRSCAEVAREYGVNESTVRSWKRSISDEARERLSEQMESRHGGEVELSVYHCLKLNLGVMAKHSELAADTEYLKQHDPKSLAVLYTAIAEKTMQIMEKVELGRHREQDMEDKLERQKAEYQAEIAELRRELEEVRDEEESRGRWGVKG